MYVYMYKNYSLLEYVRKKNWIDYYVTVNLLLFLLYYEFIWKPPFPDS